MTGVAFDLTRADWKAKPPARALVPFGLGEPHGITVHHGGVLYKPVADAGKVMRAVQTEYQVNRKPTHTDIAYNLAVVPMPDGSAVLVEARGIEAIGSANGTQPVNKTHLSVLVVGDYRNEHEAGGAKVNTLTLQIVDKVCDAIVMARRRYPSIAEILGHRQQRATVCPGGQVFDALPAMWAEAEHRLSGPHSPETAPPAPTPPAVEHETLTLGSTGPEVAKLQQWMNDHGRGVLIVDGVYGNRTLYAVASWQNDLTRYFTGGKVDAWNGNDPHGTVGPETWHIIDVMGGWPA